MARASWQYVKHLSFRNVFKSFQGKYGGIYNMYLHVCTCTCCKKYTLIYICYNVYTWSRCAQHTRKQKEKKVK